MIEIPEDGQSDGKRILDVQQDVAEIKQIMMALLDLTMRNYDVLSLTLPGDVAQRITKLHDKGQFFNSPPWEEK